MATPTLLGHLANFGTLFSQGELLCTQGLVYLLRTYEVASRALTDELKERTGVPMEAGLTYHAEAIQSDKGRPDIEGRSASGAPAVKIEAKLEADLHAGQLQSYLADLMRQGRSGALIVLVPSARCRWTAGVTSQALGLPGPGPSWPASGERHFGAAVLSWEELFAVLRKSETNRYALELEQLEALYGVLSGSHIAPLAGPEELLAWRNRETDFVKIIDRVTRRLSGQDRLLPLGEEPIDQPAGALESRGYTRRYVKCPAGTGDSYFCIGVRDPFEGHTTPIWLRFHRVTGDFAQIRQRIDASSLKQVSSSGHIWIPLEVLLKTPDEHIVNALVAQADDIVRVACPGG